MLKGVGRSDGRPLFLFSRSVLSVVARLVLLHEEFELFDGNGIGEREPGRSRGPHVVEYGIDALRGTKTGEFDGGPLPLGPKLAAMLARLCDERRKAATIVPLVFFRGRGLPIDNDHCSHYLWATCAKGTRAPRWAAVLFIKDARQFVLVEERRSRRGAGAEDAPQDHAPFGLHQPMAKP